MALDLEGGCLCGDIRYKVSGELSPEDRPSFCHCRICQQAAGAPVVQWATFNEVQVLPCHDKLVQLLCNVCLSSYETVSWNVQKDIIVTRGDPKVYHSSETGLRKFCGRCGTQIFFHRRGISIHQQCLLLLWAMKVCSHPAARAFCPDCMS